MQPRTLVVDPVESKMREEIYGLLARQFGSKGIERERDYVDLTVMAGGRRILVELKRSASARQAIRDGLGQLLDYAFFSPSAGPPPELVIVGQGEETPRSKAYVEYLAKTFRFPIRYLQYRLGSMRFRL